MRSGPGPKPRVECLTLWTTQVPPFFYLIWNFGAIRSVLHGFYYLETFLLDFPDAVFLLGLFSPYWFHFLVSFSNSSFSALSLNTPIPLALLLWSLFMYLFSIFSFILLSNDLASCILYLLMTSTSVFIFDLSSELFLFFFYVFSLLVVQSFTVH